MSRAPFVCTGHDGLDDKTLRNHHTKACKDDATRQAVNAHARAAYVARKSDEKNLDEVETKYVDHFTTPADTDEVSTATGTLSVDIGPIVEGLYPAPAPKSAPPVFGANRPSHGSSRRLRGLTNLGYTPKEMAAATGLNVDSIWWLLIAPPTTIKSTTHDAIERSFKTLRIQLKTAINDSPEVRNAARARGLAEMHDWAGAFDWESIDNVLDLPVTRQNRTGWDVDKLARAIADAALDDIATPEPIQASIATAPAEPVTPIVVDNLRAENERLSKENARQVKTISSLQTDSRNAQNDTRIARDQNAALAEELREIKAANISLHEQLTNALFSKTPSAAELAQIAATAVASNSAVIPLAEATDVFSIEFEPTLAGGFTLKLPTSLLTR